MKNNYFISSKHSYILKYSKGFTLIELLVVIAIIGILASIVLSSLNNARGKASVSAAKSNLASAKRQAELFYNDNSNRYDGGTAATNVCDPAASVGSPAVKGINPHVLAAAQANSSSATVSLDNAGPATASTGICNSISGGWAAEVLMKDGNFFCVDANGASKTSSSAMLTAANDVTC